MTFDSITSLIKFMKGMKKDVHDALVMAHKKYWENEIPNRFGSGNTSKYGYTPNTIKYEENKRKKWGDKPQLVASGRLRDAVIANMTVERNGIKFRFPRYGEVQRLKGRDFLMMRKEDRIKIMDLTRKIYRQRALKG